MRPVILAVGDPFEGMTLFGPFESWETAIAYAERFEYVTWFVTELESPE